MPDPTPIPLTPVSITLGSAEFGALCGWPFSDSYIVRVLREDIPQRILFGNCRVWVYRDPEGRLVGFGTLDNCNDYGAYTEGKSHAYVPLLAINPTMESRGYGTSIVRHLIDEAFLLARNPSQCHDTLFLDVYETNSRAVALYLKSGFAQVAGPFPDPQEGGRAYIVMAKRVTMRAL